MDMISENTDYLVLKIRTALMFNPNMDTPVGCAMAKFVQNLYDLTIANTKMIETQRAMIANQKDLIEILQNRNNNQANIIALEKAKNGGY